MDKIGFVYRILFSAKFKGHGSVLSSLLVCMFRREVTNTDRRVGLRPMVQIVPNDEYLQLNNDSLFVRCNIINPMEVCAH